jgi:hypothetical protein
MHNFFIGISFRIGSSGRSGIGPYFRIDASDRSGISPYNVIDFTASFFYMPVKLQEHIIISPCREMDFAIQPVHEA